MEGVGSFGLIWHVGLSLILSQVRINLVLMTLATLTQYESFMLLLGVDGGPGNRGLVPGLSMFREAFEAARFGYASAIGVVLFGRARPHTHIIPDLFAQVDERSTLSADSCRPSAPAFTTFCPPDGSRQARFSPSNTRLCPFPPFVMLVVSLKDKQQYAAIPWFFDHPADWFWENWANAWESVPGYIANSIFIAATGTAIAMVLTVLTSYVLARKSFPGCDLYY